MFAFSVHKKENCNELYLKLDEWGLCAGGPNHYPLCLICLLGQGGSEMN